MMDARVDEPYGDNPTLAARMPYSFDIGLMNHCLPDVERDGEEVDILKPEVVEWLQAHAIGKWRFVQSFGEPKTAIDPDTGEEVEVTPIRRFLRFAQADDVFQCRMRWSGEAEGDFPWLKVV